MEAAEQYRTLMARGDIQLCVSSADLLKEYSDKELRIIMCHNGVLMNVFCEAAQKYKEKNKTQKAVALFEALSITPYRDPEVIIQGLLRDRTNGGAAGCGAVMVS